MNHVEQLKDAILEHLDGAVTTRLYVSKRPSLEYYKIELNHYRDGSYLSIIILKNKAIIGYPKHKLVLDELVYNCDVYDEKAILNLTWKLLKKIIPIVDSLDLTLY